MVVMGFLAVKWSVGLLRSPSKSVESLKRVAKRLGGSGGAVQNLETLYESRMVRWLVGGWGCLIGGLFLAVGTAVLFSAAR
jgi:hypothetical protein